MFEKWSETDVFCTFLLQNVRFATAACIFSTSELQKVLSDPQFFYMFTCKCAFRHSGVQFFDIWTSKSALGPSVFLHFHLQMCFSPQRRAIFRHLNFKKCSRNAVFCTFSLPNVLFATAACNFSTSELQKVLRGPQFFNILTSKCAFRHSGVQFLISPLSSYLRTRRFNRPTFGLTRHTNHWKNTAFRDFSNIWRGCIFFLLTFALLHLLSADLTTLLCFSTGPYCRKFLFKLPSLILYYVMLCYVILYYFFWWNWLCMWGWFSGCLRIVVALFRGVPPPELRGSCRCSSQLRRWGCTAVGVKSFGNIEGIFGMPMDKWFSLVDGDVTHSSSFCLHFAVVFVWILGGSTFLFSDEEIL